MLTAVLLNIQFDAILQLIDFNTVQQIIFLEVKAFCIKEASNLKELTIFPKKGKNHNMSAMTLQIHE